MHYLKYLYVCALKSHKVSLDYLIIELPRLLVDVVGSLNMLDQNPLRQSLVVLKYHVFHVGYMITVHQ